MFILRVHIQLYDIQSLLPPVWWTVFSVQHWCVLPLRYFLFRSMEALKVLIFLACKPRVVVCFHGNGAPGATRHIYFWAVYITYCALFLAQDGRREFSVILVHHPSCVQPLYLIKFWCSQSRSIWVEYWNRAIFCSALLCSAPFPFSILFFIDRTRRGWRNEAPSVCHEAKPPSLTQLFSPVWN